MSSEVSKSALNSETVGGVNEGVNSDPKALLWAAGLGRCSTA